MLEISKKTENMIKAENSRIKERTFRNSEVEGKSEEREENQIRQS